MTPFTYQRPESPAKAISLAVADQSARYLGGGTNLLDLMKEGVQSASSLVDVTRLDLAQIVDTKEGGVRIGATAKNTETANHDLIRTRFPLLTQAILAGATMQIRNMASNGGNLLQRTRCLYFYDTATPCNKREPGSGCSAKEGINRNLAILGWSEACIATHPSDMAVALAALDALVHVRGEGDKTRSIPFKDFHRLPEDKPELDTTLQRGELIEGIDLPANPYAGKSHYLKVRDRASYAFALVSVAAALELEGDTIKSCRLALGGVAHKPWRAEKAERELVGKKATADAFMKAAELELSAAKPLSENGYKVTLAKNAIVRALSIANGASA